MRYSFMGVGLIFFGLLGLFGLVMFESVTVNNESEYYVLKESLEASMLESIDYACYRIGSDFGGCGDTEIKIIEQKFVENFTRRFAASISGDVSEYKLEFYDIIESPPKVTVKIIGKTKEYMLDLEGNGTDFDINNSLSGILEFVQEGNDVDMNVDLNTYK